MRFFELLKENKEITDQDLQQLEVYADRLFASLGIDIEFSKHFKDRVNDPRNQKPITMAELTRLFKQVYKQHGKPIAQLGPDAEAVMKDMRTDVNIPFALQWDGQELDLVAKTVMRKPNFATPNQEFAVENTQSRAKWEKSMIKKYGEDGWYDIADAVRDYYESNAIMGNTISDIIKIKNDHPSFTDYSGITKLYRYEKKDKSGAPTDNEFIPFAYNIKGAKNFVQSMAQGNMGFKKDDFELVEKDFRPQDAILNFTNMIELVHDAEDDDGEWYKREYEVWMKRTPYYVGEVSENFADGKVKGKSRPGRVKRAGASCKGSVTSLRAKAKKSSGEKAKMYHWCANMKSGRQNS